MPLPFFFFLASAFLLALGSVLAKYFLSLDRSLGSSIDPLPFLTMQLIGGIAFLLIVRMARGQGVGAVTQLLRPALAGIVLGVGSVGTIMALALMPVGEASVVFATQPVLVLALAWLMLGERVSISTAALCLCVVSGVIVIVSDGGIAASFDRLLGFVFAIASTACGAVYVVWMRGLNGRVDYLTALIVVQFVACLVSVLCWVGAFTFDVSSTSPGTYFLVASAFGTGMIYYGAAFYVYLIGLERTEASTAGIYLSLVPVFTIALSWIVLSERMTALQLFGAGIVVFGIVAISMTSVAKDSSQGNRDC